MTDYYKIFNLDKTATDAEIKKRYRELAMQYHPDKNKSKEAESKFKEIAEAWETLGNKEKKRIYDGKLTNNFSERYKGNSKWENSSYSENYGGSFSFDASEILSRAFNKRKARQENIINILKELTLEDIYFKRNITIDVPCKKTCSSCYGHGGNDLRECTNCNGNGKTIRTINTIIGNVNTEIECTNCFGRGKVPENKCRICTGTGWNYKTEKIITKAPQINKDGYIEIIRGKGNSFNGIIGDISVKFVIENNKFFKRTEGDNNLYSTQLIPLINIIAGGKVVIDTIAGKKKVNVPKNCFGRDIRLQGLGINGGVLIATLMPLIPKYENLEGDEMDFLETLCNFDSFKP